MELLPDIQMSILACFSLR